MAQRITFRRQVRIFRFCFLQVSFFILRPFLDAFFIEFPFILRFFINYSLKIGPLRHQVQQDQVGQEEWQVTRSLHRQACRPREVR